MHKSANSTTTTPAKAAAALVAGRVLMGLAPLGYVFVPVLSAAIAIRMLHGMGLSFSNSTTARRGRQT